MRELARRYDERAFASLPVVEVPAGELVSAFRTMARREYVGKIVVKMANESVRVPAGSMPRVPLASHATYVVTGGLSGFGLAVAQWLAELGARHLLLLGRRGIAAADAEHTVRELRERGVEVRVEKADVTHRDVLADVLARSRREMPPLRGIVHSAAVFDDALLSVMTTERFLAATAPKADGAWNLHQETQHDQLDFFVLFSSRTSQLGGSAIGSYAAANEFLNGLARARRARGLPALSVNWGAVTEVGIAARDDIVGSRRASSPSGRTRSDCPRNSSWCRGSAMTSTTPTTLGPGSGLASWPFEGELAVTDVLIAGARCAGATLAIHLARAGKQVTLVDAAALPSDQPLSTHYISPYGLGLLNELGVGDKVCDIAPPWPMFQLGMENARIPISYPSALRPICPRRLDLDALLLDEARAAGAQVRTRTRLVELVREGERVVGAVVRNGEQHEELGAAVVVGADGHHSTVAKLVRAQEYHGYDSPRAAYWAYWPKPSWYDEDPRYRGSGMNWFEGDDFLFIFPTNRDLVLVGVAFPRTQLPQWRGQHRERLLARLRACELTAPVVEGDPVSDVIGFVKSRFFFRQAAGPGWALVSDAGLFIDPAPALGISDALRDARSLASAIVEGGDEALVRYWRERDVCSIALFEQARGMGEPGYNNPLTRLIYRKVAADAALTARMVEWSSLRLASGRLWLCSLAARSSAGSWAHCCAATSGS